MKQYIMGFRTAGYSADYIIRDNFVAPEYAIKEILKNDRKGNAGRKIYDNMGIKFWWDNYDFVPPF